MTQSREDHKIKNFTHQRSLRIALLGTRGIPNRYGGFEQFAEYFSLRVAKKGHEIFVYCPHHHPNKNAEYHGVKIIPCYDPEVNLGTVGQFFYDLNCILDSRGRNFDIILQLGYTSSSIWSGFFPKKSLVVTNMDGLEWKREKYNALTRQFLKYAEKIAVQKSDHLIADSKAIQVYLKEKYAATSVYVPYGAENYEPYGDALRGLSAFNIAPFSYDLIIARFEPENNIEPVLKSYSNCPNDILVLIGNYKATAHGRHCYKRYGHFSNVHFAGAVFDSEVLDNLRFYSRLYYHGHSVGGTNPSLLEAMACGALIAAHDNDFNRAVLDEDAFYFKSDAEISTLLNEAPDKKKFVERIHRNREKIEQNYNWEHITETLLNYFQEWVN